MPPCPSCKTAGTFATRVFAPCWVTSQTGPGFSVMSMRPSGRKAMRQGRLNVATLVIVNGSVGSAFCRPALTCAARRGQQCQQQSPRREMFHGLLNASNVIELSLVTLTHFVRLSHSHDETVCALAYEWNISRVASAYSQ